jgi:phosphohistidine swiveling domain-containing protein
MESNQLREIAKELAKREWYVFERPGSPPLDWDGSVSTVNDNFSKIIRNPFKINGFVFFKDRLMIDMEDHKKINNFILNKYKSNKRFLKELAKRMEKDCDFVRKNSDGLDKNDFDSLKKYFQVYCQKIVHFRWVYNAAEVFEKIVKEAVEKPLKRNFITKYNIALNKIKKEVKKDKELELAVRQNHLEKIKQSPLIMNMINNFLESFAWIRVFHHQGEPLTFDMFMKELKENLDLEMKEEENINLREDIELLKYTIFLRTHIAESHMYGGANIKPLLEKLGKKFGLKYNEITFLRQKEIVEIIEKNKLPISKEEIQLRKTKGFACINLDGEYNFITGTDLDQLYFFYNYFNKDEKKDTNVEILKGTSANQGYVKGTAKVIKNVDEFHKFNKGDILIANSTTPNYIPIMGKALAFLTDEGGITCHAAIVSREMDKPCIIGLKNATKVIKDGDLIEVDATKGIVRKINS